MHTLIRTEMTDLYNFQRTQRNVGLYIYIINKINELGNKIVTVVCVLGGNRPRARTLFITLLRQKGLKVFLEPNFYAYFKKKHFFIAANGAILSLGPDVTDIVCRIRWL